jgi:hypothetical protein
MLIWKQKPDASFVGGFNTWLKCGRYVRKGEKGIAILAPMFFKDKNANGDDTKRIWFKIVYVFDRLSRDFRLSLCALDVCRGCHLGKSSRSQQQHHRSTPPPCATLPDALVPAIDIVHLLKEKIG